MERHRHVLKSLRKTEEANINHDGKRTAKNEEHLKK